MNVAKERGFIRTSILALFGVIFLSCSGLGGSGEPAEGVTLLEFGLDKSGDSYSVTGIGKETGIDITIPAEYQGKPVKRIGVGAFARCESLNSVIIPSSVEVIGDDAFYHCWDLSSIVIPSSVETIGDWAFRACTSLSQIVIPASVKTIGKKIFYSCNDSLEVSYEGASIPAGWDKDWNLLDDDGHRIEAKYLGQD